MLKCLQAQKHYQTFDTLGSQLQYKMSSTLTILSHPADTMMGLLEFGENLTQDTHSVCPSSCWWTKDKSSLNMSVWGNVVLRRTIGHRVYFLTTPAVIIRVKEFVYCQLKVQWIPTLWPPPLYDHLIITTTIFWTQLKKHWSFYYFEDLLNTTISLLRQGFNGPAVVALMGLHCVQLFKF